VFRGSAGPEPPQAGAVDKPVQGSEGEDLAARGEEKDTAAITSYGLLCASLTAHLSSSGASLDSRFNTAVPTLYVTQIDVYTMR
jgi:hypothetical protein